MSARERMIEAMSPVLLTCLPERVVPVVAAQLVDGLAGKAGGFLIYAGAVRDVLVADRFGPSSWEITTEQHIQDVHSWENPGHE